MNCSSCNNILPAGAKFCPECGLNVANLVIVCPNPQCGRADLPREARFCPDCGTQLNTSINSSNEFIRDSGTFIDDRDGHKYKWIKIGEQIWMAENLAYDTGIDCWIYGEERKNLRKYGRLYNWDSAFDACPDGWHLPTQEEWDELTDFLIDNEDYYDSEDEDSIAKALASKRGWEEYNEEGTIGNDPEENNSTGFNGKPGGWFDYYQDKYFLSEWYGIWWTATEDEGDDDNAYTRQLLNDEKYLNDASEDKEFGYSVRCVKD
jgi:uncharacterized protein (TIGR02145 family)